MSGIDFNAIILAGYSSLSDLVSIQLDSYNKFCELFPSTFVTEFKMENKVVHCKPNKKNIRSVKFTLRHENAKLNKSYIMKDGEKVPLYPSTARKSNKTYDILLYADVILEMTYYVENSAGGIDELPPVTQVLKDTLLSPIPCMVGSKKCHLYRMSNLTKIHLDEDPNDMGGYFIIGGSEKCIVSHKNVAKNIPQIHKLKKHADNLSVKLDFTSKPGDNYERSTYVVMSLTTGRLLYVTLTLGKDLTLMLPFFVIYYIYGMIQDKEIFDTILSNPARHSARDNDILSITRNMLTLNYTLPDGKIKKDYVKRYRFADYYTAEGQKITDVTALIMLIARVINENEGGATAERYNVDTAKYAEKQLIINKILARIDGALFPHIGTTKDFRFSKLYFIGRLIQSMINVELGDEPTDRNSFVNLVCNNACQGIIGAFKSVYNINNMNPLIKSISDNLEGDPDISFSQIFNSIIQPAKMGSNLDKMFKAGSKSEITINKRTQVKNRLFTVQFERVNYLSEYHALNGITPDPNGIGGKAGDSNLAARAVHATQCGIVCPVQSVEGERAGQSGQYALMTKFTDIIHTEPLKKTLAKDVQPPNTIIVGAYNGHVYVNYDLIGVHHNPNELAIKYRKLRREGVIDRWVTIEFRPMDGGNLHFYTMQGRPIRPLIIVYNNELEWIEGTAAEFKQWIKYTQNHARDLYAGKITLSDLEEQGVIEYISPMEYRNIFVCPSYEVFKEHESNACSPYTHLDIPLGNYCLTTLSSPYGSNSDIIRTLYQTKLSKQSMIYTPCGNYHNAFYAKMPVSFNSYRPLVTTVADRLVNIGGANVYVVIAAAGDNQEDSIIIREKVSHSLKLGCILTNPISIELENGQSLGTPDNSVKGLRCKSYAHLVNGIPKPGTVIETGMPILGIIKVDPVTKEKYDESVVYKKDKPVIIDSFSKENNISATTVIKIKTFTLRNLESGDKFASRAGNKGITSSVHFDEKFLVLENGVIPEIIVSSFAFVSRMTSNQLMEGRNSDLCSLLGCFVDGSMFSNPENPYIEKLAKERGLEYVGMKNAYRGVTGEKIKTLVFAVPMFYQRLTKMVGESSNVVDNPSIDIRTGQSNKGVGAGGGIRYGEMEKDGGLAHGSKNFLEYKMFSKCDGKEIYICDTCGAYAIANENIGLYACRTCKYTTFTRVNSAVAAVAYTHYLNALGVGVKFKTENSKFYTLH